jgi:hypothetical protein
MKAKVTLRNAMNLKTLNLGRVCHWDLKFICLFITVRVVKMVVKMEEFCLVVVDDSLKEHLIHPFLLCL